MEYLENPEVKTVYDKCKYIVKLWEHNFKKSKGRPPSKLDIREADRRVRDAYKKYYYIKTAALEQSFKDVEGFQSDEDEVSTEVVQEQESEPDPIWGPHLDKPVQKAVTKKPESPAPQKLFCGSKLPKKYAKKSKSLSQKNRSETSLDRSSQSFMEEQLSFDGVLDSTIKVVQVAKQTSSQPTNLIQSILENKYREVKSVDSGWVERLESFESRNYDSDDVIDDSDEETLVHQAKKIKLDVDKPTQTESANDSTLVHCSSVSDDTSIKTMVQEDPYAFKDDYEDDILKIKDLPLKNVQKSTPRKMKTATKKAKPKKAIKENRERQLRASSRSTKTKASMAELDSGEEDPFHSDNDSNDPEFTLKENSNKLADILSLQEKSPQKKQVKVKKAEEKRDQPSATYELEYSIKPRVAAPRFKNLKKLIKIETSVAVNDSTQTPKTVIKDKRQQEKEKLEKKIKSGGLNENFITINLKKKVYARGKKNMNFSKFKKQQWKTKKKALNDMGGCDGGVLTCFQCGQVGHFARNCTNDKGDALLPREAASDEEPCPYPTLEESSKMARESALAIRKPNAPVDGASESDDSDLFDDDIDTASLLTETLKLEAEAAKLDLHAYVDPLKLIPPYYEPPEDGTLPPTPKEVFDTLTKFGHSSFRPGQEESVMRILCGKSTLVTLSTGSGKSLCYQLPAYLYARRNRCIALVVSPLVSLMEDQVTGVPVFLKAACLHTNQTPGQRDKVVAMMGELDVLLVSPEAVVAGERSTGFGSLLRRLPPIAFACIDEAHCVSQWSHNFRPSYLMICRVLRDKMGVKTILGLTATATRSTGDSIIHHLQIPDGRNGIISDVPLPNNLILTVSKDYNRDQALLALLTSERFKECRSIIVYCTRREECKRVAEYLRTGLRYEGGGQSNGKKRKRMSEQAEPYHAGLPAYRRRTIQKAFMSGELRIVVATVAFGMGINKADIRAVIHYNMPKNFESYVQEIGRAGRDGLPAHCHLFLDPKGKDENELRRHIYANSVDRHVIRKLLQKIFLPCSCKDFCPKHEVAFSIEDTVRALDIPEENVSTLLCYLELHNKKYVELLSPAYTVCKVISYSGPSVLRKAAKECPPLAMAMALQKKKDGDEKEHNVVEFAVVDIAAAIGWDSGICKHKLKNLEWMTVNGQPKRSTLNVTFSNLGFRLLAPGNLTDEELDDALDSLYEHVTNQEKTSLLQLRAVHQTLVAVASPSHKSCLTQDAPEGNLKLKTKIREYFESPNPLAEISLVEDKIVDEDALISNVRGLLSTYRDTTFTGRAIARIFHGVASPNYPAVIWGRCKYWRCQMHVDFNFICKAATSEILNFR